MVVWPYVWYISHFGDKGLSTKESSKQGYGKKRLDILYISKKSKIAVTWSTYNGNSRFDGMW